MFVLLDLTSHFHSDIYNKQKQNLISLHLFVSHYNTAGALYTQYNFYTQYYHNQKSNQEK